MQKTASQMADQVLAKLAAFQLGHAPEDIAKERKAMGTGALAGAVPGAGLGALLMKGDWKRRLAGGLMGAAAGGGLGGLVGSRFAPSKEEMDENAIITNTENPDFRISAKDFQRVQAQAAMDAYSQSQGWTKASW